MKFGQQIIRKIININNNNNEVIYTTQIRQGCKCHQMSHFEAKMHQIRFQRFPDLAGLKGRECRDRGRKGGEACRKGRRGKKGWKLERRGAWIGGGMDTPGVCPLCLSVHLSFVFVRWSLTLRAVLSQH